MEAHTLNWADFALIGIIFFSIFIGVSRGFIREAFSLATWALAFWAAFHYSQVGASMLSEIIKTPSLRYIISGGIIIVSVVLISAVLTRLVGKLVDVSGLTGTDKLLGIVFGTARGVLVVTVLLILVQMTPLTKDSWWDSSVLIPKFTPIEAWVKHFVPETVGKQLDLVQD